MLKKKKLRYMSPAKFPTFKLIPKYTNPFANLQEESDMNNCV